MTPEKDKKLCEDFPELYANRSGDPAKTCMTWGFSCNDGWFDLIYALSKNIIDLIKDLPDDERKLYKASQVKEKYGGLSFYMDFSNKEIDELIRIAEYNSYNICEMCGEIGELQSNKWWRTVCEKHKKERLDD